MFARPRVCVFVPVFAQNEAAVHQKAVDHSDHGLICKLFQFHDSLVPFLAVFRPQSHLFGPFLYRDIEHQGEILALCNPIGFYRHKTHSVLPPDKYYLYNLKAHFQFANILTYHHHILQYLSP